MTFYAIVYIAGLLGWLYVLSRIVAKSEGYIGDTEGTAIIMLSIVWPITCVLLVMAYIMDAGVKHGRGKI